MPILPCEACKVWGGGGTNWSIVCCLRQCFATTAIPSRVFERTLGHLLRPVLVNIFCGEQILTPQVAVLVKICSFLEGAN